MKSEACQTTAFQFSAVYSTISTPKIAILANTIRRGDEHIAYKLCTTVVKAVDCSNMS
jgi:hypothetical protein